MAVEIEFLMRDNLSAGIDKAGKSVDSLGNKAEEVSAMLKAKIADQKAVIKSVEDDLKSLEKQYGKLAPGSAQAEMKAEIEACKKCLDEEKAALAGVEQEYEKTKASAKRLTTELRQMQDQLARMRLEGKQTSPEYQALSEKAAVLADTLGDLSTQTKILSHDNAGLQGVMSGANGVVGAFTVATGIMGAFAGENENLVKIQTRVQSVLAVTVGLQQVMNTLNKDSAFRIVTVTKAKQLWAAASSRLSVALGISNVAAKALMATMTLGLSVAISAIIYLWDKFSSAQAKAREQMKKFNESVASATHDSLANFNKLQKEWEKLGDSLKAKEEYINKNRDAFKALGVEINNAKDAENLLIDNADAFIESIMLKAKAAAAMELASEKYKESVQKMLDAESMPDKVTRYIYQGPYAPAYSYEADNPKKAKAQKAATEAETEANDLIKKALGYQDDANKKLKNANIQTVEEFVAGSVGAIEASIEAKKKALKKLSDPKDYAAALKEIKAEEKKLEAITGAKQKPAKTLPPNNLADTELKVRQRIELNSLAMQQDGFDKQRAQAELNYKQEKERIEKEEKNRLALYEKLKKAGVKVTPEQKTTIEAQAFRQILQAAILYDKQISDLNKKEKKEAEEKYKELLEPYRTYAQQRLEIERKFETTKRDLRAGGASEENIQLAEQGKQDALSELDATFAAKDEAFQALLSHITNMSLGQLQKALKQAQQDLKNSEATNGKNSEKTAVLRAKVNALSQELKYAKAENDINNQDDVKKWEKTSSAIRACKGEIDNIIDSMDFLDDTTRDALQSASNVAEGTIAMIDGIKMLGIGAAESLSAVEKASVILAIIGAAMQIMTALFSMGAKEEKKHQKALSEIAAAKIAMQREYNLLLMEQNLLFEKGASIFGEQQIAKAANAVEVYRQAIQSYKEELQGEAPVKNRFERMTNDALGTYQKRLKEYQDGIGGLSKVTVRTGSYTTGKWFWKKQHDVYESVLKVYPDLLDGENKLNVERAKSIIETQKMSDENKNLLQSLIDLQEQADKALEELRNYLQETFGSLGDGIMDSITNAIRNGGTDAWQDFKASGVKVLEELGEQAAQSLFFAQKFKKLQEDLEKIYGSGKSEEEIAKDSMALVGQFYDTVGTNMDQAQAWLEQWKEEAKKRGFDLYTNDTDQAQSGKAGAFTTMSQDQGTKLEGLFTAVQIHTSSIDEKMDDHFQIYQAFDKSLEAIADNTSHCRRLEKIEETLTTIQRDGIKVK